MMTDRPSTPEPIAPPFARVVQAIIERGGERLELLALSPVEASFTVKRGLGAVALSVLSLDAAQPERTRARLAELIKLLSPRQPLDLVLVGGDAGARRLLRKARPFFTRNRIGLYHVNDRLEPWSQQTTVVHKLLHPFAETIAAVQPDPERWRQLARRSEAVHARMAAQAEEVQAFAKLVQQRRPVVTYSIAGLIGVVFGLQLLWGSTSPVALIRLGALSPARVAQGEWWRLISCTFLHGGWLHVALNTYVLIILGMFLERIIGPARFLLLYAVSAVVGSLGSVAFLGDGFSVGASGAVWGLLGAHAILAFRPRGLLPAALIPGARRAAGINLGINVLNSFRPYVDMWAHFAGGAAGAALFGVALTRGLPRLGELEQQDAAAPGIPASRPLRSAAALAALVLVGGMALALVTGRPWTLRQPVPTQRVDVEGVSIELPHLPRGATKSKEVVEHTFGDPLGDPVMAGVRVFPAPDPATVPRELDALKRALVPPDKATQISPPRTFSDRGDTGLTVSYRYPSGVTLERAFLFRPRRFIIIELLRWPEAVAAFTAESLIRTARDST